ncbi:MAG: RNA polymerase sigma factor [Bacteroidota bacterium]
MITSILKYLQIPDNDPHLNEADLIQACRKGNRFAQRELYNRFAPKMLGAIQRYIGRIDEAEDVLVEGFFKVFDKLDSFQEQGSFEGWVRRIMINEALMKLRKKHALKQATELDNINPNHFSQQAVIDHQLATQDIMKLLDQLPTGYRTVFNLYVIEGYKHREIAELLGISINTSKSQLIVAKKRLREALESINYPI